MSDSFSHPFFWSYLLYSLLVATAILHMLYQRRSPQNLMAWLLTLLLLPFVGIVLYLFLGSRKFFNKSHKSIIALQTLSSVKPSHPLATELDQLFRTNKIAATSQYNQIALHDSPTETYELLISEIEKAQSSIHLQTYIFELDTTGKTLLDVLTRKAQQGLEVRLLLDAIGSFALYRNPKPLQPLVAAGGQFAFFQPLFNAILKSQINLRNHRKIYLFDHQTLLTGGMNLSNDYFGSAQNAPNLGRWKDLMLKIKGPAALHYQNIFNEDWFYTTSERLSTPKPPRVTTANLGDLIQVVPSGPDIESDGLAEALLHCIYSAKNSIHIVSPYFIPDNAIMNALLIALKRGVNVQLMTPQTSDHIIFDLGRSSYMREFHEEGGKIYYNPPPMLHAKLILIDNECLITGSANLDYRSLYINHEVVNFIYAKSLINQTNLWLATLQKESQRYQPSDNKIHKLLENLSRIFAPIL